MRNLILALPILALAGCSGTTSAPPDYAAIVGMIQTNYPTLKTAASIYAIANPAAGPGILKIEAAADPIVAALSATSAPVTIQAAATDLGALLTVLPAGVISPGTKADIELAIGLLTAGQQFAGML